MRFAKNPFPGMNPWLESYWGDVHTSLTTYARDMIQKQLPADLLARVEEYLSVDEPNYNPKELHRRIAPDVYIAPSSEPLSFAPSSSTIAVELDNAVNEPIRIRRIHEPVRLAL